MPEIVSGQAEQEGAAILHRDVLAQLIIEASTLFETDQCKAKRCIEHAAELIRRKQSVESQAGARFAARGGLTRWQVRQLTTYIDANIGARIPCDDLAALVHMSVGHFFRAFRVS